MYSSEKIDWTSAVGDYLCSQLHVLKMEDGSYFSSRKEKDYYKIFRVFPKSGDIWLCHVVCISQTDKGELYAPLGFDKFIVGKDGVLGEKFDDYFKAVLKEVTK